MDEYEDVVLRLRKGTLADLREEVLDRQRQGVDGATTMSEIVDESVHGWLGR